LMAKKMGFRELVSYDKLGIVYPYNTVTTLRQTVAKQPELIERVLKTLIEGIAIFRTNKQKSIAVWRRYLRGAGDEILEESYPSTLTELEPAPMPSLAVIKSGLDIRRPGKPTRRRSSTRRSCAGSSRAALSTCFTKSEAATRSGQKRERQLAHVAGVNDAVTKALLGAFLARGVAARGSEFSEKYLEESFDGFAVAAVDRFALRHRKPSSSSAPSGCTLALKCRCAKAPAPRAEDFQPKNTRRCGTEIFGAGDREDALEEGRPNPSPRHSAVPD